MQEKNENHLDLNAHRRRDKHHWRFLLNRCCFSLTLTERNEMSRKFKYYFNSVRPTAPENFISGSNGTFFRVFAEFHLIATHIKSNSVLVNAVLVFRWTDDRLVLRELFDDFELPKEVKDSVSCSSSEWKYPFEEMHCELSSENAGDEVVTVSSVRDLRPESQVVRVGAELGDFPECALHLKYAADWHFALLSVFLPSLLIVALVFFAQWKRRKVQVLVSLAAIMCMLILRLNSLDQFQLNFMTSFSVFVIQHRTVEALKVKGLVTESSDKFFL
ncbi:unnamed protein product [Nippostrongylus brasiliensis]|uniref:Transmembrane protein n=1 Tax=Nippostrongylus brasiliensis TaxID=27835 RepID=A0A0N4YJG7_NIPBR|nr:unnamed protein product [Nippostrongylus brasiliensis]